MAAEDSVESMGMLDWLFGRRRKGERPSQSRKAAEKSETAEPPPKIRKGTYISALIYVEGEQAPAENFAATAKLALKSTLEQALSGEHGGLAMSLKKLEVRNAVEEDGGEEEEKFEF